jgi:type I restriction enzyme R subunit
MEKEAKARIRINRLLERAGWRFFDDENGPANIALETNVKIKKKVLDQFGDDFESSMPIISPVRYLKQNPKK